MDIYPTARRSTLLRGLALTAVLALTPARASAGSWTCHLDHALSAASTALRLSLDPVATVGRITLGERSLRAFVLDCRYGGYPEKDASPGIMESLSQAGAADSFPTSGICDGLMCKAIILVLFPALPGVPLPLTAAHSPAPRPAPSSPPSPPPPPPPPPKDDPPVHTTEIPHPSVFSPSPEPATLATGLLGFALVGLFALRRRSLTKAQTRSLSGPTVTGLVAPPVFSGEQTEHVLANSPY